jgi:hypothetical protein
MFGCLRRLFPDFARWRTSQFEGDTKQPLNGGSRMASHRPKRKSRYSAAMSALGEAADVQRRSERPARLLAQVRSTAGLGIAIGARNFRQ